MLTPHLGALLESVIKLQQDTYVGTGKHESSNNTCPQHWCAAVHMQVCRNIAAQRKPMSSMSSLSRQHQMMHLMLVLNPGTCLGVCDVGGDPFCGVVVALL